MMNEQPAADARSIPCREAALAAADFAAQVFLAPELPELETKARALVPHLLECLCADESEVAAALRAKLAAFDCTALEADALTVRREHAKLFLGVGESTIPLSISVWTSEKGLLRQEASETCRKAYADAGIALDDDAPYDPDHVGTAFAFLSLLEMRAEAAREAAAEGEEPEDAHQDAETVDPTVFYRTVASRDSRANPRAHRCAFLPSGCVALRHARRGARLRLTKRSEAARGAQDACCLIAPPFSQSRLVEKTSRLFPARQNDFLLTRKLRLNLIEFGRCHRHRSPSKSE